MDGLWIEVSGVPTFGEYAARGLEAPTAYLARCLKDRKYRDVTITDRAMLEAFFKKRDESAS